jgi:hypothetical protein
MPIEYDTERAAKERGKHISELWASGHYAGVNRTSEWTPERRAAHSARIKALRADPNGRYAQQGAKLAARNQARRDAVQAKADAKNAKADALRAKLAADAAKPRAKVKPLPALAERKEIRCLSDLWLPPVEALAYEKVSDDPRYIDTRDGKQRRNERDTPGSNGWQSVWNHRDYT